MGLKAGLDWRGKSRPTGIRSPDRPARRQSLYRLRYPAHQLRQERSINRIKYFSSFCGFFFISVHPTTAV